MPHNNSGRVGLNAGVELRWIYLWFSYGEGVENMMNNKVPLMLMLAMLSACDKAEEPSQPGVDAGAAEQTAEQMDEVRERAGESADESADCGPISWALEHLPEQVEGLSEAYRGCESPVTAMVVFETEGRTQMGSITVLNPALAGLTDSGTGEWQQLLDQTRAGVLRTLLDQEPLLLAQDDEPDPDQPQQVPLGGDTTALLFGEPGSWELIAMAGADYAIKFVLEDDTVNTTDQARELIQPMLVNLTLPFEQGNGGDGD